MTARLQAALYHSRRRRVAAAELDRFDNGTVHNLSTPYTSPANGHIAIEFSNPTQDGDLTLTVGDEVYPVPGGQARFVVRVAEGQEVSVTSTVAGTATLFAFGDWRDNLAVIIATGDF